MSPTTRRSFLTQVAAAIAAASLGGTATVGATGCSSTCVEAVRDLMDSKLESFISFGPDVRHEDETITMQLVFDGQGFQAALSELVQRFGQEDVMLALAGD